MADFLNFISRYDVKKYTSDKETNRELVDNTNYDEVDHCFDYYGKKNKTEGKLFASNPYYYEKDDEEEGYNA